MQPDIQQILFHPAMIGQALLALFMCISLLQAVCFFAYEKEFAKQVNVFALSKLAFILVALAYALLTFFYISSDFSLANVFANSHTDKPLLYKITGVWGNHEGSMLLFLLVLVGFNALFAHKSTREQAFRARMLHFQGVIALLMGIYIYFTSNPFDLSPMFEGQFPANGQGLNPLLQDIGLAIHPPTLYFGYVGFSLAFSAAVTLLQQPKTHGAYEPLFEQFTHAIKPWVLASWGFLTLGVALGSWWAYRELGWGGFWFWDPVENSSLMPWLSGTALLHAILALEKRKAMKGWVLFFSILTFTLSLVGFFLVRSGILSSVHSFAADPTRGTIMLVIISIISIYGFGLFAAKAARIQTTSFYKLFSREGEIAIGNILIISLIATIMLGVFYPLVLDLMSGRKISVGEPYFELTFIPIGLLILLLTTFGPYTKWQADYFKSAFKGLRLSFIAATVITLLIGGFFFRKLTAIDHFAIFAGFWLALSMVHRMREKLRNSGKLSATFLSMFFAHTGIAVMAISIALLTSFDDEQDFIVNVGDKIEYHGYEIEFKDIMMVKERNFIASRGVFELSKNGRTLTTLNPDYRVYIPGLQKTTEADIHYGIISDIYLVIGQPEESSEHGGMEFAIKVFLKPFMNFVWVGTLMIFIGGMIGAFVKDKKKKK